MGYGESSMAATTLILDPLDLRLNLQESLDQSTTKREQNQPTLCLFFHTHLEKIRATPIITTLLILSGICSHQPQEEYAPQKSQSQRKKSSTHQHQTKY